MTSTTLPEAVGLRERKRRETKRNLAEAATHFATTIGLERTTIDAISDRAGVSARTFFNYFDCKEDAVLGTEQLSFDERVLAEHQRLYADAETVEAIVGLLRLSAGPAIADADEHRRRVDIIRRYPQLMARQLEQMTRMMTTMELAVDRILARDERFADADALDATVVLGTCFSAFRVVVRDALSRGECVDLDAVQSATVARVRRSAGLLSAEPHNVLERS